MNDIIIFFNINITVYNLLNSLGQDKHRTSTGQVDYPYQELHRQIVTYRDDGVAERKRKNQSQK